MRIGIGWDVHKLVKGRKLILGGIEIPFNLGLKGYSDADVLTHAIIDSILGAIGSSDIGTHFPSGDRRYKNISSMKLLSAVIKEMRLKKYTIENIDSIVITQAPRIGPHAKKISVNLARALNIPSSKISVKAKTEEGLGYIGKGKAIAAQAVCLLSGKG